MHKPSLPWNLPLLDGLKGIAVLMVLLVHCYDHVLSKSALKLAYPSPAPYLTAGKRGVELFFLISAFTLFHRLGERFATENSPRLRFYITRFFRIWPPWAFAIILGTILDQHRFENLVIHLGMAFGWINVPQILFTEWSLFVEEIFYFALPLIFPFLKNLKSILFCLAVALIPLFIWSDNVELFRRTLFDQRVPPLYLYSIYVFFLGILLHHFYFNPSSRAHRFLFFQPRFWTLVAAIAIIGLIPQSSFPATVSLVIFFIAALNTASPLQSVLCSRPLIHLGKRCYSIYLLHPLVTPWLQSWAVYLEPFFPWAQLEISLALAFPVYVLINIMMANVTYYFLEIPSIALGRRLIHSKPTILTRLHKQKLLSDRS